MDQTLDGLEENESCEEAKYLSPDPLNKGYLFEMDSSESEFEIPETPSPVFAKKNSKPYQVETTFQDRRITNEGRKPKSVAQTSTLPPKRCLVMTNNTATWTPEKHAKRLVVEDCEAYPSCLLKSPVCLKPKQNKSFPSPNSKRANTTKAAATKKYLQLKKSRTESKLFSKSRDSSAPPVKTNYSVATHCHSPSTVSSSHYSPTMKRAKSSSESLPVASSSNSRSPSIFKASNACLKENGRIDSAPTSSAFELCTGGFAITSALKSSASSPNSTLAILANGASDWIDLLDDDETAPSREQWKWEPPIIVVDDDDDSTDSFVRFAQLEEDEAFARQLQAQFDMEAQHQSENTRSAPAARENSFHEFCGLPGCGEHRTLLASSDIGYCGKPGCSAYQRRNAMLNPEVIDPVLHGLQRFFDETSVRRRRRARRCSRHQTTSLYLDESTNDGNDYEELLAFEERQGSAVAQRKLSTTEINCLPTKLFDPEHAAEKTQCHICFNDYVPREKLRILPCLHDYHSQCIDRWLKGNSSCPICRVDVNLDSS
ncbi:uncharacterized protein si:ch211-59o9.10 isoform X1 [Carcharodon carcharias]|uniref:uncharacterized protein si:ch211-59o9.10 isoform X1 n=2 Tax=Carcharodon carcharias TaxID=13397 RepID=UPI001B7EFDC3|nr:uncharacterized protein si:ch211-59o9.10 isoform X1 [Carcharodon carcharias]XP_041059591.1 uncharacterized protein si:ch211-59o9.10 isoform X1 [Carcharodon carcharias]